jgi:hypothetical protein
VSTFNGLPAHALLVHLIVVLAPLTALLAITCAVWPAARQRLTWLVLALAVITTVATPLTTEAGEWLEHRVGSTPQLEAHTELGDTMIYFALALLIGAILLAVLHVRESRGKAVKPIAAVVIAAFIIVAAVSTTVQVYRIGDSGAQSVWGGEVSAADSGGGDGD